MTQEMKVEPLYKITVKDKELILTRTELKQLRDEIDKIIAPITGEKETESEYWALQDKLDVPKSVPRDLSPFAQAMLAVCIKHHKGYENRVDAGTIADEIMKEYPEVAKFYESKGRIVFATIFAADNGRGGGLVPAGLLKMTKEEGSRVYWVD